MVGKLDFYFGGYFVKFGWFVIGVIVLEIKDLFVDCWYGDLVFDFFKVLVFVIIFFDEGCGIIFVVFWWSYYEFLLLVFVDDFMISYFDYQLCVMWVFINNVCFKFFVFGVEDVVEVGGSTGGSVGNFDFVFGFYWFLVVVELDLIDELMFDISVVWEYDYIENQVILEGNDTIKVNIIGWILSIQVGLVWCPVLEF